MTEIGKVVQVKISTDPNVRATYGIVSTRIYETICKTNRPYRDEFRTFAR